MKKFLAVTFVLLAAFSVASSAQASTPASGTP
jgi:hypothetical protein